MVNVAVTGVGGLIGRRVVAELDASPEVERIVGLDIRVPEGLHSPKLELRRADVRDVRFDRYLGDVDAVVHLAFQMDPVQDEAFMHAINVDGTRNVMTGAVVAGVRKIVYVSSGVAYGAHPDNDVPLTEDSPLRANPDFNYAEHKLAVERWLWSWLEQEEGDHPDLVVTVLRPSIVAGPGVQNFISRQLEAPRFTVIKGHRPPMQFTHVDDVASALAHAVRVDLPGAYNVSSEGWLSFEEVLAISRRRTVEVGEEVAFQLADRLWRAGLGEAPPGQVHYLMHPWVLSVDKLVSTGWRPKHSNRDALAELVEEHHDFVSFAGVRTQRSTIRRVAGVAVGAALALGVQRMVRGR